jgi:cell division protease FtsH
MSPIRGQKPTPGGRGPQARPASPIPGWVLLLVLVVASFAFWFHYRTPEPEVPYTFFKQQLTAGNVKSVLSQGGNLRGQFREAVPVPGAKKPEKGKGKIPKISTFQTTMPAFGDDKLMQQIVQQKVELVAKSSGGGVWKAVLILALPFLLIVGFFFLMTMRAGNQAGGLMSIGRSKATRFEKEHTSITFDDVAGVKEAKEGLQEVIGFLREPGKFQRLGCRVPKGILLVGPPGTGKTLLARATAGEAEVPFFSITGSDFVEMFVGVGASRVRDLFHTAKRNSPCIIFLDELDSVGRHRGAGLGGGHDEREQTLNQLLSEIDGFEPSDNVLVIAATNRPDVLDPALLRPGRFDRRVVVDLPAVADRVKILEVHTRHVPLDDDVDLQEVAASMPGRSGADLANLVNEAAILTARRGKDRVGKVEFGDARDQILIGQLRGSIVLHGDEKRTIAVHEAGHALVAHIVAKTDPVEKVSIIPRGSALGATQQLPEERYNYTSEYMRARLEVMLAGRASENVLLNSESTGAADDLAQATRLARRMVGQWGMSEKLGNVAFEETGTEVFLGEMLSRRREYSEATARDIDLEVKRLIEESFRDAKATLEENRERLDALARALEKHEVLEGEELELLLEGKTARVHT